MNRGTTDGQSLHAPADMSRWQGRVDSEEGALGRRWHQTVQAFENQTAGVALIGFACDAGVARNHGRVGASEGPRTLRATLANLPVRACGVIVDAGDVACVNDRLEAAQDALSRALAHLLGRGLRPITLGGGHEVAYGSWGGLARHLAGQPAAAPAPRIGIVNLDAHFDLRLAERASSGTPFRQIAEDCAARGWPFRYCCLGVSDFANTTALFERAHELGVVWRRDEEMHMAHLGDTLAMLDEVARSVDHIYLTVCLDVLPAAVAPGVSAPAARGVELAVVEAVVDRVVASHKLRLADVAELNPRLDDDSRTARVAARLVGRIANAWTGSRLANA